MSEELRVLVVEDRVADAELVLRALRKGGLHFTAQRVDQEGDFLRALEDFSPDVILSDLSLPAFSGTAALQLLHGAQLDIPLIFVSGTVGDEKAVDLLKLGAADYVIKDNLVRLVPVVERTLRTVRLERDRQATERRYRDIFEMAVSGIWQATPEGRYLAVNPAYAAFHGYASPHEMRDAVADIGRQVFVKREAFEKMTRTLEDVGVLRDYQVEHYRKDGGRVWLAKDVRVVRDAAGKTVYYEGFAQDITQRKDAEAALEAAQSRLIEASRYAGMAEVATNVLHNVGNVLNSVNVSTSLLSEKLRTSALPNLGRALAMLRAHQEDLAAFFRDDPRAAQLVSFLAELVPTLEKEHSTVAAEVRSLGQNIEHINSIVAMQQHYTTVLGVVETARPFELMEDALRMNAAGLVRHGVEIAREYRDIPAQPIERHKVLQILVNLISNAKYALDGVEHERQLILRIGRSDPRRLAFSVIDNGIGIDREHLTRIFEHGFTTRKGGHGFGLHSSALAAQELGGSLAAASDGPGRGATFTLELPMIDPHSTAPPDAL